MIFVMIIAGIYLSSLYSSFVGWMEAMFIKKLPKCGSTVLPNPFKGLVIFFKSHLLLSIMIVSPILLRGIRLNMETSTTAATKCPRRSLVNYCKHGHGSLFRATLAKMLTLVVLLSIAGQSSVVAIESIDIEVRC